MPTERPSRRAKPVTTLPAQFGDDRCRLVHHLGDALDLLHHVANHLAAIGRQLAGPTGKPVGVLGAGRQVLDPCRHFLDRRRHGRGSVTLLLAAAGDMPRRRSQFLGRAEHRAGTALDILDQRTKRPGHFVQAVADQLKMGAERFLIANAFPLRRFFVQRLTDLAKRLGIGMPDPSAEETFTRRQVDVEARAMRVLSHLVAKLNADIRLVRRLVLAEAGIAVDPHQRSTHAPVVSDKMG